MKMTGTYMQRCSNEISQQREESMGTEACVNEVLTDRCEKRLLKQLHKRKDENYRCICRKL